MEKDEGNKTLTESEDFPKKDTLVPTREQQKKSKINRGGLNLIILGALSVLVATVTTGVSLAIYHNSGDIYLDRSRPGYLPDEQEIEDTDEKEVEYELDKTGKITMEVLEEYLENLNQEVKSIDAYDKPFNQDILSDKQLGIPAE